MRVQDGFFHRNFEESREVQMHLICGLDSHVDNSDVIVLFFTLKGMLQLAEEICAGTCRADCAAIPNEEQRHRCRINSGSEDCLGQPACPDRRETNGEM
jgi:hypothetical protein